jgi:hypothetical protein
MPISATQACSNVASMPFLHRRCELKGLPSFALNSVKDQHDPTPNLISDFQILAILSSNVAPKACEIPI